MASTTHRLCQHRLVATVDTDEYGRVMAIVVPLDEEVGDGCVV